MITARFNSAMGPRLFGLSYLLPILSFRKLFGSNAVNKDMSDVYSHF